MPKLPLITPALCQPWALLRSVAFPSSQPPPPSSLRCTPLALRPSAGRQWNRVNGRLTARALAAGRRASWRGLSGPSAWHHVRCYLLGAVNEVPAVAEDAREAEVEAEEVKQLIRGGEGG